MRGSFLSSTTAWRVFRMIQKACERSSSRVAKYTACISPRRSAGISTARRRLRARRTATSTETNRSRYKKEQTITHTALARRANTRQNISEAPTRLLHVEANKPRSVRPSKECDVSRSSIAPAKITSEADSLHKVTLHAIHRIASILRIGVPFET